MEVEHVNQPIAIVEGVGGAGCEEVREPVLEKRESDMELDSEVEVEGESKGKVGRGSEIVKLPGIEEGLDEGQEVELEQESLEIWGRPWSALVQANMATETTAVQDKDCPDMSGGLEGQPEKKLPEEEVGATTVEVPAEVRHFRGKRKSEEGRRLQEELESQNIVRGAGTEQGPAQRTRASRRSLDAGDDLHRGEGEVLATERKAKTRKQKKDGAVEKAGQKKSSKRKLKETSTIRTRPDVASPGDNPSG